MANTHTSIDAELELTFTVKVKADMLHYYGQRTEEEIKNRIEEFKKQVGEYLLGELCNKDYSVDDLTDDYNYCTVDFKVEK